MKNSQKSDCSIFDWETHETENLFLTSCVFLLENGSPPSDLYEIVLSVDSDWFTNPFRRIVFDVVRRVVSGSGGLSITMPGSILAVSRDKVEKNKLLDKTQSELVFAGIFNSPSKIFTTEELLDMLPAWRTKLIRWGLLANLEELNQTLLKPPSDKLLTEIIPSLIEKQQDIWSSSYQKKEANSWANTIQEVLGPKPENYSMSTGLNVLDDVIHGGIQKPSSPFNGNLITIAGRASMGKSAFSICLATRIAAKHGDVAFFSLEMSAKQITFRSIACLDYLTLVPLEDPIRPRNLLNHSFTPDQRKRLNQLSGHPITKRLRIFDLAAGGSNKADDIIAKIRLLHKTRKNLCAIFIDYLQLMQDEGGSGDSQRVLEISRITRKLKLLARSIKTDIFIISQVNRGVEQRSDKMPLQSDLRESGSIEQDSDIILFLLRPHYYDPSQDPFELGLSVAKNRNGPVGRLRCAMDCESSVVFDTKGPSM